MGDAMKTTEKALAGFAIAMLLVTACNYDEGACWLPSDDGQGGAAGGPIVPTGAGGSGNVPPKPQDAADLPASGGCHDDWSDIPACNKQFVEDRARCKKVKTERCWASAMDRLAFCNKTGGKTGFPALDD